MLTLSIKHPDANKFIDAKVDTTKITGANCSIKITDEFMKCVKEGYKFLQTFPTTASNEDLFGTKEHIKYNNLVVDKLYFGKKKNTYYRLIDAQQLWEKIIHNAWKSAEPGVMFWDTILRESPSDSYAELGFRTVGTNPCSEIPMNAYDSCRLLAMNLYSYVKNPFTPESKFDFDLFKEHVKVAQRIMDDIVDLEIEKIDQILKKIKSDPEEESLKRVEKELWIKIKNTTLKGRRTGLGITSEGDMLAALGYTYASQEGINMSEKIHKTLAVSAYLSSIQLAQERGAFEIWSAELEKDNPFIKRILKQLSKEELEQYEKTGRRNIACITVAPTGTTSIMTQTTSGIEPVYQITYKRRRKTDNKKLMKHVDINNGDLYEEYSVFHHKFINWFMSYSYIEEKELIDYQTAMDRLKSYSEEQLKELITKSPYYKSTSDDIDWISKVRMQGKIQKWVDHSISCTVNLPKGITEQVVNQVYMTAWESGCKGCTVFRTGSRDAILFSTSKNTRPNSLDARVIRFMNGSEKWIAFIGIMNERPFEVFGGHIDDDIKHLPKSIVNGKIVKVKNEDGTKRYDFQYDIGFGYRNCLPNIGQSFNPEYHNYARFVSTSLQEGVELLKIINTLDRLECGNVINPWNRGIARALRSFIDDGTKSTSICEYCGSTLVFEGGCEHCPGCGWGKCDIS